ncbi:MAG: isoaspartyl peptidase/L-asparaginase family protein [Thermoanaerobaculia bacterium]
MKRGVIGALGGGILLAATALAQTAPAKENIVLVIHGGAGTIRKANMTPEREREYREKLSEALRAGWTVLDGGGSSLDAVEAAIRIMEDSPLFNSGKGAVFTHQGRNELDASIMDGATRRAGAVAGVTIIRNPITAARAVMEKSKHVLLTGRGAELFATRQGLEIVDPSYFWTERRWKQLQDALRAEEDPASAAVLDPEMEPVVHKFGTVGAVALDRAGNLAAGTSTGGMTNKRWGRVGDSPIIGAGTWADNDTCAVSSTGHGEFFIRWAAAYDVAALMEYRGLSVEEAARTVIHEKLEAVGGDGGMIVLDAEGNFATPFNTEGMYRGWIRGDGVPHVALYEEQ